jgi:hypothetical protein
VSGFSIVSELSASAEAVWSHAISPAGVNDEMFPLLRMTFPRDFGDFLATWRPNQTLFRSWLLVGGVLPIEYDDIAFAEVEPGRRFLERSVLLSQRVWEHERAVEPRPGGGCRVTDRVAFEPRLRALAPLYEKAFRFVFAHRHRRLRKRFGAA